MLRHFNLFKMLARNMHIILFYIRTKTAYRCFSLLYMGVGLKACQQTCVQY